MNDYFDASDHTITAGTRARAAAVNAAFKDLEDGFGTLPSDDDIKRGLVNYAVDSGAANAYVVALTHAPSAYADGLQVVFKASASNTGACTINVNSLGVKTITRQDGTTPIAGDIGASKITEIRYNSTSGNFEIQGSIGASAGTGTMSAQNANAVNIVGGTVEGITTVGISGGTINGITAETSAGAVTTIDGTQTLTNKTHTSPRINTPKINEDVSLVATTTDIDSVVDERPVFVNAADGGNYLSATALNVVSSHAGGATWETVGPTGGTVDIVWAALDDVPAGADWIEVRIYGVIYKNTGIAGNAWHSVGVGARNFGGTASALTPVQLLDLNVAGTASNFGINENTLTHKIPVDTKRFEIYLATTGTADSTSCVMYLTGYGWNA